MNNDKNKNNGKETFEVGYGKPPKASQFKKGKSGNPAGKPKGSKNTKTVFSDVVLKKRIFRINGEERVAAPIEAIMMKLTEKACHGDMRAVAQIFKLAERLEKIAQQEKHENTENPTYGAVVVPARLTIEEWKAKYESQENED